MCIQDFGGLNAALCVPTMSASLHLCDNLHDKQFHVYSFMFPGLSCDALLYQVPHIYPIYRNIGKFQC